jgi:putative ABC transport system permease protein
MTVAGLTLFLKRLKAERVASLALVGLLFVTDFVTATAPRLLEDAANHSLRGEIAAAGSRERSIQLIARGRLETAGTADLEGLQAHGRSLESAFDPTVEGLVESRSIVVETPLWQVSDGAPGAVVTLRVQEGVESHITLVAGHLPMGAVLDQTYTGAGSSAKKPVPAFEAALSAEAATRMSVGVGDSLAISIQTNDPRSAEHAAAAVIDIVAVYEVPRPDDGYWIDDDAVLHSITYLPTPTDDHTQAALLLSPAALSALMVATAPAGLPMNYSWRCYLNAGRLDAGQVNTLVAAMRRLEAIYPSGTVPTLGAPAAAATFPGLVPAPTAPPSPDAALESGLLRLLQTHLDKWQSAQAILIVAATGTAAVAAAMVWLAVLLAGRWRRHTVSLARRRGASLSRVLALTLAEAVLISIVPAVLAAGLAAVAIPNGAGLESLLAEGGVTALGVAALLATALGKGGLGGDGLADPAATESSSSDTGGAPRNRRLVIEGAIVIAAVGAAYLVRERAIAAAGPAGRVAGAPDPLIEAVPVLAGIAAAIVAIRSYPILMGLASRLAARQTGLVPLLALRHAARGPGAGAVLLVMIMTAMVGTFAASVLATLDGAADTVAWQQVGAAYRVDSVVGPLNTGLDPGRWPGVEAVAPASQGSVALGTGGFRMLETIDMEQYQAVLAGTPTDPGVPAEMLGRADEPFPAIVSAQASGSFDQIAKGDVLTIRLGQGYLRIRAVAVRSSFPGLPAGSPFIVISRRQLTEVSPAAVPAVSSIFVRAPDQAAADLRAALGPRTLDTIVVSRAEQAAAIRSMPVGAAVAAGIAAAAVIAILCAALAVAATLFLAASAQAVETSHLRTIGLTGRQAAALILVEFTPTVVVALIAGAGLGFGLFLYLRPGLGVGTLIGSTLETPAALALPQLVMLFTATAGTAAIAIIAAAVSQRSASPAAAIRRGIQQ